MKLYKHQAECVEQILKGFKTNNVQCLAWYTGSGKTNIFIDLCKRLIEANPKVKIGISCYMTTEIRDQVMDRLKDFKLGGKAQLLTRVPDPAKNIFVFIPHTPYANLMAMNIKFDYLICDESQSGLNPKCLMLNGIRKKMTTKNTKMLLVTATPWDMLTIKEFRGIPVFKRPLDMGLKDGLISDVAFHAEESDIKLEEEDFNKEGDLKETAIIKKISLIKSACVGKMKYLLDKYDSQLGKKVLVICPPGNLGEVTRELASQFGGLPFTMRFDSSRGRKKKLSGIENTNDNLEKFTKDPSVRFLYVINKCSVGFDMKEISSVVDLTMSRNLRMLGQRYGRVARRNRLAKKRYFYVYDKSLMKERLDWLLFTMVDFALGNYDGWGHVSVKYRPVSVNHGFIHKPGILLSEVVGALRSNTTNKRIISWTTNTNGPPTKWTVERALKEAEQYTDRTDMWRRRPALYKWFRLNAKDVMDRIFPLKHHIGKWHEKSVIAAMGKSTSRFDFRKRFPGARAWVQTHKRNDLMSKYLPKSKTTPWTRKDIEAFLISLRKWDDFRKAGGMRKWTNANGGQKYWKKWWAENADNPDTTRRKKASF